MKKINSFIQATKKWIANFVIHYNLCPFAKKPFVQNTIRYVVYEGIDIPTLAKLVQQELIHLNQTTSTTTETTLIIIPHLFGNFIEYLDFLEVANRLIFALRLEGEIQIASFHPNYQFADSEAQEVTNYTNRSPFPMIHLLKEASIEEALKYYEHPDKIPERNMELMRKLRKEGIL